MRLCKLKIGLLKLLVRVNFFLAFVLCLSLDCACEVSAQVAAAPRYARNKDFIVPEKLRPRVNFWKDIFTKYGRANVVVHHREFPQIIFMVVDLSKEYEELDAISFEVIKKATEKKYVAEVKQAIQSLEQGLEPTTYLQKFIAAKMQFLGPGNDKYRRILDDDLIRTQTGIKEKFEESVKRAGRYLPLIEKIFVEDYGLPVELTRLPFIESSFDYTAYSSVGAAGIWQFMPRTGRLYMTVGKSVDERRDPIEASRGAAIYLRDARARLNTWPLAITSYNHGIAGVASKVAKQGTSDIVALIESKGERAFGFASTNFYPEFLAAMEIYENYKTYFPNLQIESPIKAREIVIQKSVSVQYMAQQVGVSLEALKELNYALMPTIWNGRARIPAGYRLKVPDRNDLHLNYIRFDEPQAQTSTASSSAIYGGLTYKVRKGDTIIGIAKKFATTVEDLKAMNNLGTKGIRVGQELKVKSKEFKTKDKNPEPVVKAPATETKNTTTVTKKLVKKAPVVKSKKKTKK